ncbi:MAG: response regulator [Candidatus Melainabacteria bacterium]|nr:response regulator [Candidatus Melainabacteria bacterium]
MMLPKPQILIIHEAGPASEYAKVLEKTGAKVSVVTSFEESNELLSFLHPDLIVLSANMPEGDGRLYCQQIRASMANPRPVLVLLHSSSDVNERINAFRYGADDVLPDPIDTSELAIRILAHLRRRQEDLSNQLTQMPGPNVIRRMLEQSLVSDKKWAAMSIDLNKIRVYNETYGDLAGDQLIKALGAILVDIADETDFVGHLEADDFLMVTRLEGFELKAKRICEQFDSISTRFYPREDLERGYLVSTGRGGIRRRVPLISVAIGIVTSRTKRFQSYIDVLTTARDARYLAKETYESSCIVANEGQQVDTALSTSVKTQKNDNEDRKILVVEPDGAMACLLQEILSLEGYMVEVTNSAMDALEMAKIEQPDLILLESTLSASERQMDGWSLCKALKDDESLHKIWVVMATSHPDQLKALEAGADLYLPKPFDMPSLLKEVSLLLRSRLS